MRVTILGCGGSAGVPVIGGPDGTGDWGECDPGEPRNRRTRASIVVESGAGSRLAGRYLARHAHAAARPAACPAIDAVLFTHAHADHITGLDDVRVLNRIVDRPLDAFGTAKTLDEINRRFEYAFRPWQPPGFYRPVLTAAPGRARRDDPRRPAWRSACSTRTTASRESLGLRIGGFGYSTDVVELDEAAFAALAGVDTWLVDCFQRGTASDARASRAGAGLGRPSRRRGAPC